MVCRKLVKWTLIGTVVAGGAGYLVFGKNLPSYVATAFGDVQKAVKGSVPIDFELKRARTLISKIDPEIRDARRDVARAEVELERNEAEIGDLRDAIAKSEHKMKRHRGYIAGEGDAVPVFETHSDHGFAAVRRELCRTFDMYKNQVELLKSKEALRNRQQAILDAARTKLTAVRSERNKLMDMVETLEARKRQQDAIAASVKRFDLDTSALSQAKAALDDIKTQLDISAKIIQEELFLANGTLPPGEADDRDILKEMDDYFGEGQPKVRTLEPK